jgi:osmotically-inducible protein OsmY
MARARIRRHPVLAAATERRIAGRVTAAEAGVHLSRRKKMPQDQRGWRRSSREDWEDEREFGRGRDDWRGESRSYRSRYEDDQSGYGHDNRQDRDYQGTLRAGDYGRSEEEEGRGYPERFQSGRRSGRESGSRDYGGGYGSQSYGGAYSGENQGGGSGHDFGGSYGAHEYGPDVNVVRSRRFGGAGGGYGYYGSASAGTGGNYGQSRQYGGGFGSYTRDYERKYGSGYGGRGERDYGSRERDYGNRERDWWDRATDEVSSWFGDEDAERRRRMDHHRGRGPKNYTRSDDRIREDVSDRLTDDPLVDASDIEVSVSNQEVTLNGTVASRNERRLAEEVAEQVSGVKYVQNNLRVKDRHPQSGMSGTSGTFGSGSSTSM